MEIIEKQDELYPKRLLKIKNPPEKLYVEGDASLINKNSIAIVGTRKCTKYGEKYAAMFAEGLSKQGISIVSGMALGIDSIAHLNSMQNKGRTVAVLGGGFNKIFPEENKYLYDRILENGGCVLTEYPPDEEACKEYFPQRNRIISGISMGVLVVEARHHSGSSITARYAFEQGKPVFCIPHSLDVKTGYTPNLLIQMGAKLVLEPANILSYYDIEPGTENDVEHKTEVAKNLPLNKTIKESLESNTTKYFEEDFENQAKEYKEVYNLVGDKPISINEISSSLNVPISSISEILFMLELKGYITNLPGNNYVRKMCAE